MRQSICAWTFSDDSCKCLFVERESRGISPWWGTAREVLSALGLLARIVQMFVKSCWHLMLFTALVAATGPVCAQGTEAGRFLSVVGDVRVGREGAAQRVAQRAAEFYEGESIVTAVGALAQLRMTDGALMSVRGDTEIKLERFSYAGEQDRNASFLMSVLKGGLRSITGVIGRQNRERYRITTATVTIGVRGTDFEIVHVPLQAGSREGPAGYHEPGLRGGAKIGERDRGKLPVVPR